MVFWGVVVRYHNHISGRQSFHARSDPQLAAMRRVKVPSFMWLETHDDKAGPGLQDTQCSASITHLLQLAILNPK